MNNALAQIDLGPLRGFGKLGLEGSTNAEEGVSTFAKFLSSVIGLMTIIAVIWFVFVFFAGAIGMIGAGGDKTKLETSRQRIMSGLIGLVVTIAAIFIIKLVGQLIGIPNILNLGELFTQITK